MPNSQETADLVTFTEEIHHGKLHFLCSVHYYNFNEKHTYSIRSCRRYEKINYTIYQFQRIIEIRTAMILLGHCGCTAGMG